MRTIEFNFKEKLILILASVTLLTTALFLISFDQILKTQDGPQTTFGKVQSKNKLLKRKNIESMLWEDIDKDGAVFLGDKIFTPEGSHATLQIGKNSFIEMSPLTLIQLKQTSNREPQVDLQDGVLKARIRKDELHSIQTNSADISLNRGSSEFIVDQNKTENSIIVLSGAVLLENKSGTQELNQNEIAKFNASKASKPEKIDYLPLEPSSASPTPLSILKKVKFKWKKISKTKESKLIEIAQDSEFKKILKKIVNNSSEEQIDLSDMAQGSYFWRIKNLSKELGTSQVQKFIIFNDSPPNLLYPQNNVELNLPRGSIQNLKYQWEDTSATSYVFETNLIKNESTEAPVQKLTNSNQIVLQVKDQGHYWWRVKAVFQNHFGPWSEKNYFKIQEQKFIQKAVNLSPANESIHHPDLNKITFKWKGHKETDYKLQISNDISFQAILHEAITKDEFYDWNIKTTGSFFWKITHLKSGTESNVWTFKISTPLFEQITPKRSEKIYFKNKNTSLLIKWAAKSESGLLLKGSKEVVILKNGKEIDRMESSTDEISWPIKEAGKYQWRVQYLNHQSDLYEFEVINAPILEAPKIKEEIRSRIKKKKITSFELFELKTNLFVQNSNPLFEQEATTVNFAEVQWDSIEDAKSYYLEIYQDQKGKELLLTRRLKKNFFHWQGAPTGTYYFRVAYEDSDSRKSPFSKLGRLIVEDIKDTDRFIELKYPKHKHSTYGERFGFEWKKNEQVEKYIILIKDFQTKKLLKRIESITDSIMTPLLPGLYRWQVLGLQNEIEIALSEERYLKVVENKNSKTLIHKTGNALIRNVFEIDSLIGQTDSASEVTRSSIRYKNNEKLTLFPNSFRFGSTLKINQEKFLTSYLDYKNGNTDNVNFLSQVTISGSLNWLKKMTESFAFFYGPSIKYDSISLVSEDSSQNIGGSSLSYLSTGAHMGLIHQINKSKTLTQQLHLGPQFSFITAQGQTLNIQYQIRKDKIYFFRNWNSIYENIYAQIGFKYSIQTAKSSDDSLQLTSWEIPLGIGFYLD